MARDLFGKQRWLLGIATLWGVSIMAFALSFVISGVEQKGMGFPTSMVGAPSNVNQLVTDADIIVLGQSGPP